MDSWLNGNTTYLFVNRSANNGRGGKLWDGRVGREVKARLSPVVYEYEPPADSFKILEEISAQEQAFNIIVCGGDGTVNHFINELISLRGEHLTGVCFGAIALGSSNDLHKPRKKSDCLGVPASIDFSKSRRIDIGKVQFTDELGTLKNRYYLVNSSIGFTASANYLFNRGDYFIDKMKSKSINLTIWYTALKAFFSHKNVKLLITDDNGSSTLHVSNMNLLKRRYVAGSFFYDEQVGLDDGLLGVNVCYNMNKAEMAVALLQLTIGRFNAAAKKRSTVVDKINIESETAIVLETDGEVFLARSMQFTVLKQAVSYGSAV